MPPRTIAIGDIHGCAKALDAILDAVNPSRDDTLIVLGDTIDRGPQSRQVIERLIALGEQCRLVTLLGNHEEMLLAARDNRDVLLGWLQSGGAATLDSYGFGVGPDQLPEEHLAFLEACVPYYETDTHVFLHANYDPNVPIDQQSPVALRWESLRDRIPERHISGKTIIVGHTPQPHNEILDRGYLKAIDTCCHGGGWLTALEVVSGQIWQTDREGVLRS